MNNELDLAKLEELLETMEPEEIRARYADRLSPRGHALLAAFDSLSDDLAELKMEVPPPTVSRRIKPIFRWAHWVTPLAALLVLGIALAALFLPETGQRSAMEAGRSAADDAMAPKQALASEASKADTRSPQPTLPAEPPAEAELELRRSDAPATGGRLADKQDRDLRSTQPGQVAPAPLKKEKRRAESDAVAAFRQQPIEEAKDGVDAPQPLVADDLARRSVAYPEAALEKTTEEPVADAESAGLVGQDRLADSKAAPPLDEEPARGRTSTVRFKGAKREAPEAGEDEADHSALNEMMVVTDAGEAAITSWLYQYETAWKPDSGAPAGLFRPGTTPRWPAGLAPEGRAKPAIHLQFLRMGSRSRHYVLAWTGAGVSGEMSIVLDRQGRCRELKPLP